jgi:hypothetical protein
MCSCRRILRIVLQVRIIQPRLIKQIQRNFFTTRFQSSVTRQFIILYGPKEILQDDNCMFCKPGEICNILLPVIPRSDNENETSNTRSLVCVLF